MNISDSIEDTPSEVSLHVPDPPPLKQVSGLGSQREQIFTKTSLRDDNTAYLSRTLPTVKVRLELGHFISPGTFKSLPISHVDSSNTPDSHKCHDIILSHQSSDRRTRKPPASNNIATSRALQYPRSMGPLQSLHLELPRGRPTKEQHS